MELHESGAVTPTALAAWARNADWKLTGEVYCVVMDVWEAEGKPRIEVPCDNSPAAELNERLSKFLYVPFHENWYELQVEVLISIFAEDAGLSEREVLSRLLQESKHPEG